MSMGFGFRKTVPDKWEFANDHFRRGQEDLLSEIRRRKAVIAAAAESNSAGDDDSTSSPGSKNPGSVENMVADLSGENKKLKRENDSLSSELAAAKRQRDELVAFLTDQLKVGPEQIDQMVKGGKFKPNITGDYSSEEESDCEGCGGDGEEKEAVGEGLKLFGVWVKGERKKRGRDEKNFVVGGSYRTDIKNVDFHAPLWKRTKVCN
ncbi:hypothetical protein IGI04_013922 [Brassica rapa subsp. trilocularis]|uniref:HSF-type DNA-binding domain-containing protein n=1 Tax=Brassica rapa subsp. trilocularis TaxID=1813537 RepID=A0ABQ7NAU7_BRACM|nr:hypothetical protein IGI04_013922 [Brassica rapa subsp. trilocularis]